MEKLKKQNTFKSRITGIYVFLLLTFFPLIMHDGYGDIFRAKSLYFYILTVGYILLIIGAWIGALFCNEISDASIKIENVDVCILLFFVCSIISWLFCENRWEQFWGTDGRNMGLFTIALCAILYILIKRYGQECKAGVIGMFVTFSMVSALAVVNHMGIDPLDVYSRFDSNTKFMSTMGNINTLSAYLGIVSSFAMVLFCLERRMHWRIFYGVVCFIGFVGVLAANSDSAHLTIIVTLVLVLFFAKEAQSGTQLLMLLCMDGLAGMAFEGMRFLRGAQNCVKLRSGIGKILIKNDLHQWMVFGIGMLLFAIWIYGKSTDIEKKKESIQKIWTILRWLFIGLLGVAFIVIIGLVVYSNLNWTQAEAREKLGGLYNYLYLSNSWGTYRLRIWKAAWKTYCRLPFIEKLVGVGPAGFYYATQEYLTAGELQVFAEQGRLVDAHNVYLQALVVFGCVGTCIYIGFFISAFIKFIRKSKVSAIYLAFASVVAAYLAQAFVNNMHIYMEPFVIILLAIGMGSGFMRKILV